MLTLYAYVGNTGGAGVPPINYKPQLETVLQSLAEVIAGIKQHEVSTGLNFKEVLQKLTDVAGIGEAIRALAEKNAVTQENILAAIKQVSDAMGLVRSEITDFKSAALDKIETLSSLIEREFDQTQLSLADLKTTIQDLLTPKSKELKERRKTVISGAKGLKITIPRGANEISAYALDKPFDYIAIVNGERRTYAAGELYAHDWANAGNILFFHPETTFEIPPNSKFQVSWRGESDIGEIQVADTESGTPIDSVLDERIPLPDALIEISE